MDEHYNDGDHAPFKGSYSNIFRLVNHVER